MVAKLKPEFFTARQHKAILAEAIRLERLRYLPLLFAAAAARDTLDSFLRNGARFSKPMYEAGYQRLSDSIVGFPVEKGSR